MSPLRQALADYLQIRRALGYKLERAEKLLEQYLEYLDALGAEKVTIDNAVAWATLPAAGKNGHCGRSGSQPSEASPDPCTRSTTRTRSRQLTCCPTGCTGRSRTCTRRRTSSR